MNIRQLDKKTSPGISCGLLLIFTALVLGNGGCSKRTANIAGAIKEGHSAEVRTYLDHGGDPNIVNDMSQSLLLLAAIEKHPDIVHLLLVKGANPNSADQLGQTPLFFASYNQDLDSVAALITAGANVNAVTSSGEFALLRAVVWGNTRLVEMLVQGGADVNMKPSDPRVQPPLQIAIQGQMKEIEAILRQAGATE
ncbi:MAG: ankyrin repeat domain-containing protein [Gammaproteobacteria bacterium]